MGQDPAMYRRTSSPSAFFSSIGSSRPLVHRLELTEVVSRSPMVLAQSIWYLCSRRCWPQAAFRGDAEIMIAQKMGIPRPSHLLVLVRAPLRATILVPVLCAIGLGCGIKEDVASPAASVHAALALSNPLERAAALVASCRAAPPPAPLHLRSFPSPSPTKGWSRSCSSAS